MTKVTSSGDNMNVLIACDYTPLHHWMAFASWYSFQKLLPDAKVSILCNRKPVDWQMFDWARTCKVKMRLHQPMPKIDQVKLALSSGLLSTPLIVVDPDVVMVREIVEQDLDFYQNTPFAKGWKVWVVNDVDGIQTEADICSDAREEKISTFAAYPEGWGKFVTALWINTAKSPFQHRFGKVEMTSNEVKVDKLWKQLASLFQTVSRG